MLVTMRCSRFERLPCSSPPNKKLSSNEHKSFMKNVSKSCSQEPSIAQLVVAEDCSWKADIFRSLVQVRLLGIFFVLRFFFFSSSSFDADFWRRVILVTREQHNIQRKVETIVPQYQNRDELSDC